jgi:SNF2 family DNA or RNA helicase
VLTRHTPWAHQLEAYNFALPKRGALLDLAPGTGKTKIAVDLFVNSTPQDAVGVVLCPLSVVEDVWQRQVPEHSGDPELRVVALARGTVAKKRREAEDEVRAAKLLGRRLLLVVNYESAWRPPLAGFLLGLRPALLVLDESHRCKSPTGKLSTFARSLAAVSGRRLALSGTPAPHSPLDLWAQVDAVAPGVLERRFFPFRTRYAVLGGFEGKQVVGFRRLEELQVRLAPVVFKVGNEVLDLPPLLHERRSFDLSPAAAKVYRHLEEDLYAYLEASGEQVSVTNALERLLRLQQITGGWVRADGEGEGVRGELVEVDTGKRELLLELLGDLPASEPVVVFCRFHSDLDAVVSAAASAGRPAFELSGRRRELPEWRESALDGAVLGVQIQSGGVGVDLTAARYVAYFSLGYSLGDYLQSLARVHRPGQTRPVVFYHLVARNTVDVKVYEALSKRQDVIAKVLGLVGRDYNHGLDESC